MSAVVHGAHTSDFIKGKCDEYVARLRLGKVDAAEQETAGEFIAERIRLLENTLAAYVQARAAA